MVFFSPLKATVPAPALIISFSVTSILFPGIMHSTEQTNGLAAEFLNASHIFQT